jgi:putative transcriptional regulator
MTIKHHPTDIALSAFTGGTLDEARALVVATHISLCAQCQKAVAEFECVAGTMLQELPPTALRPDALSRALALLEGKQDEATASIQGIQGDIRLPAPLQVYKRGPWRWLGRGIEFCAVDVPADSDTRVFMLKAAPGIRLPHHKHTGTEWTCVFQGAFTHEGGHFGPGDFDEADEDVEHRPIVGAGDVCICLVALQGRVQLQGWAGRLLQPLLRF